MRSDDSDRNEFLAPITPRVVRNHREARGVADERRRHRRTVVPFSRSLQWPLEGRRTRYQEEAICFSAALPNRPSCELLRFMSNLDTFHIRIIHGSRRTLTGIEFSGDIDFPCSSGKVVCRHRFIATFNHGKSDSAT